MKLFFFLWDYKNVQIPIYFFEFQKSNKPNDFVNYFPISHHFVWRRNFIELHKYAEMVDLKRAFFSERCLPSIMWIVNKLYDVEKLYKIKISRYIVYWIYYILAWLIRHNIPDIEGDIHLFIWSSSIHLFICSSHIHLFICSLSLYLVLFFHSLI